MLDNPSVFSQKSIKKRQKYLGSGENITLLGIIVTFLGKKSRKRELF
jgi:hypothetical protein